jgi:hypothetical protein
MAAPKYKTMAWSEDKNLHEKKIIETLKERLNDKICNDPRLAKKAAMILEEWLLQKPKK